MNDTLALLSAVVDTPWGLIVISPVVIYGAIRGISLLSNWWNNRVSSPPSMNLPVGATPQGVSKPLGESPTPPPATVVQPCPNCGSRRTPGRSHDPKLGIERAVCVNCGQILT